MREEPRERLERVLGGDLVWEFILFNQPANSKDLNMNGLAFFVSAKSMCWKDPARTVGGMIQKMAHIFAECPREKSSSGFITLQVVMNQIVEHDGGNDCRLGHTGKERSASLGELPLSLDVHEQAADWDATLAEDEENDGN